MRKTNTKNKHLEEECYQLYILQLNMFPGTTSKLNT